ncbi:MAG TPA: SUMF1/EgtB/PvdO family nonheme iron enzyme [Oscillatoriaceae cyanobacterium M33_DOE_052]|uniref:Serine/threonine protein kinase n=1 Tax=Planktothricoides sp. SpSt-374 TaxID=2282167 RepID=A0A7C3ZXU2_9CYAN|nr:SUMF1/EgtB/PvdO family nonheme iron enzyme [Oscillatoriaceae cyanobacterium M33_DOE_052]
MLCINPNCINPQNPDRQEYCQQCGSMLISLLRGRYRITQALGQGGFGKTYLAEDIDRRNAKCVIKQFAPEPGMTSNPGALQKATELFNQEAERLLQLEEHPQIPTLYAYFEENLPQSGNNQEIPYQYLVQQYIKGQTLQEELKAGPFSETKIRELLQDLLPVLDFIHQHKVIHRDIKPENIIRRDSDQKLALIDFGVAKANTKTLLTRQGTTVGTSGYAPLEQMMQGIAYPASDLYSLGVTCIRLLTRCLPNTDGSDKLYNAVEGCWVWREYLPNGATVSSQLGEILDKLLETGVKNRYQSATEVLKALNFLFPNLPTFKFTTITVNSTGEVINSSDGQAPYFRQDLGNGIFIDMVAIPGGTFLMGSPDSESGRIDTESPQHQVTVPSFYLGKYPITQAQYQAIMGQNPSHFQGSDLPVERVTWSDAVEFCQKLAQKTGITYRLPSEAEWEYACRAGTTTPFHFGDTITTDLANCDGREAYANGPKGQYQQKTTPVGSFPPNAFGLYDMHGNVWEWCQDRWHENHNNAPTDGSAWVTGGQSNLRVLHGGSWNSYPRNCRCSSRFWIGFVYVVSDYGFRVAVSRLPVSGS